MVFQISYQCKAWEERADENLRFLFQSYAMLRGGKT